MTTNSLPPLTSAFPRLHVHYTDSIGINTYLSFVHAQQISIGETPPVLTFTQVLLYSNCGLESGVEYAVGVLTNPNLCTALLTRDDGAVPRQHREPTAPSRDLVRRVRRDHRIHTPAVASRDNVALDQCCGGLEDHLLALNRDCRVHPPAVAGLDRRPTAVAAHIDRVARAVGGDVDTAGWVLLREAPCLPLTLRCVEGRGGLEHRCVTEGDGDGDSVAVAGDRRGFVRRRDPRHRLSELDRERRVAEPGSCSPLVRRVQLALAAVGVGCVPDPRECSTRHLRLPHPGLGKREPSIPVAVLVAVRAVSHLHPRRELDKAEVGIWILERPAPASDHRREEAVVHDQVRVAVKHGVRVRRHGRAPTRRSTRTVLALVPRKA
eukprot:m.219019 g.219019  ORF g.219019 m.219019 type:complete len:379 (+) comp25734_c0_seq3:23-1159(+)